MSERFSQPPAGHRDWYAFEAIRALPRILLMVDKNPFSSTYGCFDREFWHYRTIDFPCGMSQEFCLPLALAYEHPFPGNPYYRNERLRELVIGSIEFAKNWSHADSSCDDYFPFERALGARNIEWGAKRDSQRLGAPELWRVSTGAFAARRQKKVAEGTNDAQYKPTHLTRDSRLLGELTVEERIGAA